MKRKIYGARGMLDWQMALNVSGAFLKICFSGGYMGGNGVIPAKYSTDNKVIQNLIEKSRQFESGMIVLLDTIPIDKDGNPVVTKKGNKNADTHN